MKPYISFPIQRIGIGVVTALFVVGGLVAPGVHRFVHTAHDLEMLFPGCDTACNDEHNPDADGHDASDEGDASSCMLCKLSTLGMDMPVFSVLPVIAVAPGLDIGYVLIRMDDLPCMSPSARGPPA